MGVQDYTFPQLWEMSDKRAEETRVLSFDPGKTTGWAFFLHHDLHLQGQIETRTEGEAVDHIQGMITDYAPQIVVYEEYRIYRGKTKEHQWSDVLTLRIIGALQTLCHLHSRPTVKQGAQIAKQFVTDDKLKIWNYYIPGQRHARDAIRHGCYYLLFGG